MGNFFGNLGAKLQQFMIGRNGPDKLSRWALGGAIVVTLVGMFVPNVVLTMVSYALLFYSIYRMFSTNVSARRQEDEKFAGFLAKLKGGRGAGTNRGSGAGGTGGPNGTNAGGQRPGGTGASGVSGAGRTAPSQSKAKVRFTCDNCGQSLSVPKGRGKLKVTCPTCHHQQTIDS